MSPNCKLPVLITETLKGENKVTQSLVHYVKINLDENQISNSHHSEPWGAWERVQQRETGNQWGGVHLIKLYQKKKKHVKE